MDINNAIEVRNMTKYFKVEYDKAHTLKERLLSVSYTHLDVYKRQVIIPLSFIFLEKKDHGGLEISIHILMNICFIGIKLLGPIHH